MDGGIRQNLLQQLLDDWTSPTHGSANTVKWLGEYSINSKDTKKIRSLLCQGRRLVEIIVGEKKGRGTSHLGYQLFKKKNQLLQHVY